MEGVLFMEAPAATIEMQPSDFAMEQCVSRPPEKILIMPNSSSLPADAEKTPLRSPSASSNKPARARSSLLSIISGGDKKSPTSSVSSSNEEPLSPASCTSPTVDLPSAISSPTCTSPPATPTKFIQTDQKLNATSKPVKKVPPPTLAKTFKSKSSPTTETAVSIRASLTEGAKSEPLKKISEAVNVTSSDNVAPVEDSAPVPAVNNASLLVEPASTASNDSTVSSSEVTEQSNTAVAEVVSTSTNINVPATTELEENVAPPLCTVGNNVAVEHASATSASSQAPSTVVELPPPVLTELLPETGDAMEFPPPPDIDFLSNNEPTEISSADNWQIAGTVNITQLHEIPVTKDAYPELCKQGLSTRDSGNDSTNIPSHPLNHASGNSSEPTDNSELVSSEISTAAVAAQGPEEVDEPDRGSSHTLAVSDKESSVSFYPSSSEPSNSECVTSPSSNLGSSPLDESVMTSGYEDTSSELNSLPPPPPESDISALDTAVTPQGCSDIPPPPPADDTNVNSSSDSHICDQDELTVAQHLEDSSGVSSTASPGAHSPPFNTSSESGDSGVESGQSLVGETVTVTLRPTTNDNRKPESSVPMFERNSNELKRVTFRESGNQVNAAVVAVRKSAAEEERIKRTGLSDDDISQAELFYKGHMTEVMVCPCLATLYFSENSSSEKIPIEEWKPEHIGIPVLTYDNGSGKRERGLTLVIAEKGTGFLLWRTVINYESRWEVVETVFHRMRVQSSTAQFAGIAYQDEASAKSFYDYFKTCTADPEKNVLNNPNIRSNTRKSKKEKRKSLKLKPKAVTVSKSAISKPCEFTHVTQLKQSEDGIMALAMVPVDDEHGPEVI